MINVSLLFITRDIQVAVIHDNYCIAKEIRTEDKITNNNSFKVSDAKSGKVYQVTVTEIES